MVKTGHAVHPYTGLATMPLDPSTAAYLNLSVSQGVLVMQIDPDSPADKAGLQPQDVITAIDGRVLEDMSTYGQILNGKKPGDTLQLDVVRGTGKKVQITVTLGKSVS